MNINHINISSYAAHVIGEVRLMRLKVTIEEMASQNDVVYVSKIRTEKKTSTKKGMSERSSTASDKDVKR